MSGLSFAAECPRCHTFWTQKYRLDQLRAAIDGELQLEFWCQQCGATFEPDQAQLERLKRRLEQIDP
jgi:hypothetical protein